MKMLKTKQEIAVAINMHEMPVVRIDLADADEYGIKSQKVLIDNGKFRRLNPTDPDMPYLVRAEIRAFVDERKFTFASYGCCLSNTFGYHDMEELLDYANAPIIKRDSDVVLAIVDSRRKIAYKPIILHTRNRVDPNCQVPLGFTDEDNDATEYIRAAGCREWKSRGGKQDGEQLHDLQPCEPAHRANPDQTAGRGRCHRVRKAPREGDVR